MLEWANNSSVYETGRKKSGKSPKKGDSGKRNRNGTHEISHAIEQKPNQKKSKIKHKRVKTFLGNTPISLPATVLNSPFSSKNDIGTFKSSNRYYLGADQERLISKLINSPFKTGQGATLDQKRDSSLEMTPHSFNYPVRKNHAVNYQALKKFNSSTKIPLEDYEQRVRKIKSKNLASSFNGEPKYSQTNESTMIKSSNHGRHRSDSKSMQIHLNSNYSKYIQNPKNQKNSKSIRRMNSQDKSEKSRLINSVHVFGSKKQSAFDIKKHSISSGVDLKTSKRSPSIIYLKKNRTKMNTGVRNSPVHSSNDSLRLSKERRKIKKHSSILKKYNHESSLSSLNLKSYDIDKKLSSSKKSSKKNITSYSKPQSPTRKQSQKLKPKKSVCHRKFYSRRVSKASKDHSMQEQDFSQSRKGTHIVGDESSAQTPSEFSTKTPFGKDLNLKSKYTNSGAITQNAQKHLDISNFMDLSKISSSKSTQFNIPKNLGRKQSY